MNRKIPNEELDRLDLDEFKKARKNPVIVILDNIRSAQNVGSVFRTMDAFLMEGIYLCGITAAPPNREIQKTALGSTSSVMWKKFENTKDAIAAVRANDYAVFAVEQVEGATLLNNFSFPEKTAIIFGNEVEGVDANVIPFCDGSIEIPQFGTKHSLNISVCAGIVLWEAWQRYKRD